MEDKVATTINRLLDDRCREHPLISRKDGIHGISPHIKGVRFRVHDVLTQLYHGKSIGEIMEIWQLTEEQVKEAIAYAQDFLSEAIELTRDSTP